MKNINFKILALEVILVFIGLYFVFAYFSVDKKIQNLNTELLYTVQVADSLKESSDDLTKFARSYVVTKNNLYKEQYEKVLDIRDGKIKRPYMYNSIYWDISESLRELRHPSKEKLSFKEIASKLPYDISGLAKSEEYSNKLVNLEIEAFNAVEGKFKDKNGNYIAGGKPDQDYAIKLLFSKEYKISKEKIMDPIDEFVITTTGILYKNKLDLQNKKNSYISLLLFIMFLFILMNYILYFLYKKDREKVDLILKEKNKEQENLLSLFEYSDLVLFRWNNDDIWSIDYVSVNSEQLLGYTKEDFLTSKVTYSECIHKDDLAEVFKEVEAGKESGDLFFKHKPYRVVTKDNKIKWVLDNTIIIRDEQGKIKYFQGYIIDITEEILTREKLQNSNLRWKFALEGSGDGIWDWNLETSEVYFSSQWKKMLGFKDDEIKGVLDEWESRVHPDDIEYVNKSIEDYISGKIEHYQNEHRILCKDGTYKWILDRGIIVQRDENNKPIRMIGTHTDLSKTKESEHKLKNLTNQLIQAQHTSKLGSWTYNILNGNLEWSDEIFNIFSLDRDDLEASYDAFLSVIHPSDRDFVNDSLSESLKNKTPYSLEHRLLLKDGTIKHVRQRGHTEYDEDSKPLKTVGTVQDITEEVNLKEQILQERNFISTIIESANAIIAVIDNNGIMKRLNKYGQDFVGYEIETISKEPYFWAKFLPENVRDNVANIVKKANDGEIVKAYKNSWVSKTGEVRVFEWSNTLVKKDDGSMNYIATIGIDVTEKEKVEQQVLESKQKFETLLSNASDAIFIITSDTGKLIEYSSNVKTLLGYSDEEVKNLTIMDWDNDINSIEDYHEIVSNVGFDTITIERVHVRKDKTTYIASITANKVVIDDKEYIYASVRDITKEREQEEELKRAKELADSANKAKSNFLANMSHEIRTPLNGIIGLTDLTLETELNDIQKDYLNKSKKSSKALLHVINDILDYSKIEAGKLDIVNGEFSFEELLDNVNDLFGYKAYEKRLSLNFFMDSTIPQTLIGDSLRITQILNNLVGNALKFTNKGHVSISVNKKYTDEENKKVGIEFCIEDSGVGISKENQNKLFAAFEQGDSSTTKKFGGTGLGLMITKQLLELMDGDIQVKSEDGSGTKFCINLALEYVQGKSFYKEVSKLNKKTFLIVDDSELDRDYLVKIFNSWNMKALDASDGVEALKIIEEEKIDYLIVDWLMPNMDGVELLKELKNRGIFKECIIMITAHDKQELYNKADKEGVLINKVLQKPYTPSSIYDLIIDNKDISDSVKSIKQKEINLDKTKKVLVAEDNEINQIVIQEILANVGLKADIAKDGLEALNMAKNSNYDIIFMDIQMPNMDGFEATKKIREFDQETPILALSAAVMKEDKELTKEAGMNGHLAKPIDKEELYKVLNNYFGIESKDDSSDSKIAEMIKELDIKGIDLKKHAQNYMIKDMQNIYVLYDAFKNRFNNFESRISKMEFASEEFNNYIHTLKGVSGNLNINGVFELCKEIEKADDQKEVYEKLKVELSSVLEQINDKISSRLEVEDKALDKSEVIKEIDKMISSIEKASFISRTNYSEFLSSLIPFIKKEQEELLVEYFDIKNFDELLKLLKVIKEDLQ